MAIMSNLKDLFSKNPDCKIAANSLSHLIYIGNLIKILCVHLVRYLSLFTTITSIWLGQ